MSRYIEKCDSWYRKAFKPKYKKEKTAIKHFVGHMGCFECDGVKCLTIQKFLSKIK